MTEQYQPYEYDAQEQGTALGTQESQAVIKTLGGVPALPAGYFISFLVALEGVMMLVNRYVFDNTMQSPFLLDALDDGHNPFSGVLKDFLAVLAFGDVTLAVGAVLGLYLATRPLPRSLRVPYWVQTTVPSLTLGALLAWRLLVAVAAAPWVGVWLAFAPPDYDRVGVILVSIAYIAVNVCIAWSLVPVVAAAARESQLTQLRDAEVMDGERQALVARAQIPGYPELLLEDKPVLFGCLPLELTVGAYASFLCIGSLWCLVLLFEEGRSVGGWAFLTGVPKVDVTFWLEVLIFVITFVFSLLAMGAMLFYPWANNEWEEEDAQEELASSRKRRTHYFLAYLVASVLRFALFIPTTGMALLAKDICGFYSRGVSQVLTAATPYRAGAPMRCGHDWLGAISVLVVFFVDAYLIVGSFRLWRRYRADQWVGAQGKLQFAPLPSLESQGYGAPGSMPASTFLMGAK